MIERHVIADTLPQAYHHALWVLNASGQIVDCPDYGTRCKELTMTIEVAHPLKEPMISRCIPCGAEMLKEYCMEMLDGIKDFALERGLWPYTYHDRYATQIPAVIEELTRNPQSRRAVMVIARPEDIHSDDPPCLQHIQFFIRATPKYPNGQLDCKVLFRSNDAARATFMNAFALIMLQKRIADALGVPVGTYVHRANSFHAYEGNWEQLEKYAADIAEHRRPLTYSYTEDWKEQMEDAVPEIMKKVEALKNGT